MNHTNQNHFFNNNIHNINNDDRIMIEKHYIPIALYRELYSNQFIPIQTSTPRNIFRNNFFPSHINPNNHNNMPMYNPNIPQPFIPQPNIPQQFIPNMQVPLPDHFFMNLRNELFNIRNIPFDIQISNFPPFVTHANPENILPVGIPLSNINTITTVSRFCDIRQNNLCDSCTICQLAFNNIDICRTLNNCNHIFHLNCIDTWLNDHVTCPSCRNNLLNNNNNNNDTINNINSVLISERENEVNNEENNEVEEENNEVEEEYNEVEEEYNDEEEYYDENYEDDIEEYNYEECALQNKRVLDGLNNPSLDEYDQDLPSLVNDLLSENETTSNPQVFSRVYTNTSNISSIFNTEPMLNDINNFVNMTTPFINNFISSSTNSNASARLNPDQINTQINRQINNFVNNLNPFLSTFNSFGNRF